MQEREIDLIEKRYKNYTKNTLNKLLAEFSEAKFIMEKIMSDLKKNVQKPKYSEAQNQFDQIKNTVNKFLMQNDIYMQKIQDALDKI
jgi:hypothetical protein